MNKLSRTNCLTYGFHNSINRFKKFWLKDFSMFTHTVLRCICIQGITQKKYGCVSFLQSKKTDMPKACKMAAGGLGSAVSPPVGVRGQSPQNVLILFCLKHGKTAIVKVKIQQKYLSNHSVQLTVNLASVKFTSVNLNLQLFFEINHKDRKNRNVEYTKARSKGERKHFIHLGI